MTKLMQSNVERWMPVVGYEGLYEVSNWGRVRGLDRKVRSGNRTLTVRGRILAPSMVLGYEKVDLRKDGQKRSWTIHILVAAAFIGPRPLGNDVLHGLGGKLDNRPSNLRYGTRAENCADMVRDGTALRGERASGAKLTREQVLTARQLVAAGPRGTASRLARVWGVSRATVSDAVLSKRWAWLKDQPA